MGSAEWGWFVHLHLGEIVPGLYYKMVIRGGGGRESGTFVSAGSIQKGSEGMQNTASQVHKFHMRVSTHTNCLDIGERPLGNVSLGVGYPCYQVKMDAVSIRGPS